MLEFGRQVALEIVLDDEDVEEVWIAPGTKNVPGQRGHAESNDRGGVKQAEGIAPAPGEKGPEKNHPPAEDNCRGAFGENREPEKEPKQNGSN